MGVLASKSAACHATHMTKSSTIVVLGSLLVAAVLGSALSAQERISRGFWKTEAANDIYVLEKEARGAHGSIKVKFEMKISDKAHGLALVFWNAEQPKAKLLAFTKWDEPNLPGSFAIAFDCYDPRATKVKGKSRIEWFDARGNFYGRPQHQISLHFDGRERENIVSPVEFRSAEHVKVDAHLEVVCGGSELTLKIDGQKVFDHYFVPAVLAYDSQIHMGFRNREGAQLDVQKINIERSEILEGDDAPETVRTFDKELIATAKPTIKDFELVERCDKFGRIIAAFTISKPEGGWDQWDRSGRIDIKVGDDKWLELCRIMTPYRREWTWYQDVTDYAPLLQGKVTLRLRIPTWIGSVEKKKGFAITLDLQYYEYRGGHNVISIQPVWRVKAPVGDPARPIEKSLPAQSFDVPANCKGAKLRMIITGHNGHSNIAEFTPLTFWINANKKRLEHRLWIENSWLNPCRPQGGTWKFDRAGWRPGDLVPPLHFDLSNAIEPGKKLKLSYGMQDWVDEKRNEKGGAGHHDISACLVFYR